VRLLRNPFTFQLGNVLSHVVHRALVRPSSPSHTTSWPSIAERHDFVGLDQRTEKRPAGGSE